MLYDSALEAIAAGESQSVEFKQQLSNDRQLAKALSALANSDGGWLIVGISDAGIPIGLSDAEIQRASDRIRFTAAFGIDPPIELELQSVNIYGQSAIAVRIPDSLDKPHYVMSEGDRAGVFVRRNAASVPVGVDMLRALKSRWGSACDPLELGRIEQIWVDILQEREQITIKQFCKIANVSRRRAHRIAVALVNAGVLNVFQHDRETYYALNRDSLQDVLAKG